MKLFLAATLLLSLNVKADIITSKLTCKIDSSTGFLSGGGIHISRPITEEECFQLGLDEFNSPVMESWNTINPLKNTVTQKTWQTQNKRVKAAYITSNGSSKKIYKRKNVEKKLVSEKITKIESGFRCWTQGECVALEE